MTTTYIYNAADGDYFGTITRDINPQGEKVFAREGVSVATATLWVTRLAQRSDAPVIVVEGEKTADAAGKIFPDYVCMTSPFGAPSAAKADWTPLHGRTVVIWPDNDGRRQVCRRRGADSAGRQGRAGASVVPGQMGLADELPEGITLEALGGLLLLAEAPKVKAKKPSKADLRQHRRGGQARA